MTKPVSRRMAVDCLLYRIIQQFGEPLRCGIDNEPLLPGQVVQFDHTHADVHGGGHTYKDIRPVHYDPCHKKKTKADVQAKSKGDRILGLTCNGPKKQIQSRGFDKTKSRKFSGAVVPRVA